MATFAVGPSGFGGDAEAGLEEKYRHVRRINKLYEIMHHHRPTMWFSFIMWTATFVVVIPVLIMVCLLTANAQRERKTAAESKMSEQYVRNMQIELLRKTFDSLTTEQIMAILLTPGTDMEVFRVIETELSSRMLLKKQK